MDKPHRCGECPMRFRRREHLARHLDRHRGRRPYKCASCDLSFSRKDTLKRHGRLHEQRPTAGSTPPRDSAHTASDRHEEIVVRPRGRPDDEANPLGPQRDNANGSPGPLHPSIEHGISAPALQAPLWESGDIDTGFSLSLDSDFSFFPYLQPNDFMTDVDLTVQDVTEGYPFLDSADENEKLIIEDFRHVPPPSEHTYEQIFSFLDTEVRLQDQDNVVGSSIWPTRQHINVYTQLFFEHCYSRLSFVHLPTFNSDDSDWLVVLATAALGCQYTSSGRRHAHLGAFDRVAQVVLKKDIRTYRGLSTLALGQALLLFHDYISWSGQPSSFIHLLIHRNSLAIISRQLMSARGSLLRTRPEQGSLSSWEQWVQDESKCRLIYGVWSVECFWNAVYAFPLSLSPTELPDALPCEQHLWRASRERWTELRGMRSIPVPLRSTIQALSLPDIPSCSSDACLTLLYVMFGLASISNSIDAFVLAIPGEGQRSAIRSTLDKVLHISLLGSAEKENVSPWTDNEAFVLLADLFAIVRFVGQMRLVSCFQWQSTPVESDKARAETAALLQREPVQGRECLARAARLFARLQSTSPLVGDASMYLHYAAHYIRAFIELAGIETIRYDVDSSPTLVLHLDHQWNDDEVGDWIQGRLLRRIHLRGIGLLDREGSARRVTKAVIRAMSSDVPQPRMASVLANGLKSLLDGIPPAFNVDSDSLAT